MSENKKCWACKRTLVDDSKLGLCPDCMNKYGSPAAAAFVLGVGIGVRQIVKNGDKIIKIASTVVRH
jgi:hypothetical protein